MFGGAKIRFSVFKTIENAWRNFFFHAHISSHCNKDIFIEFDIQMLRKCELKALKTFL